ncbi:MAG: molybdopterin-dependent oxidoreductase [Chloroflexi bacterium]|nr:molybdopterin-dependent oxidoreductase [Chloroflexota bacterium]
MAKITLDGREIEAPEGAPLVEVIKNSGIFISNLCYIDDLPPYAGCRTCLVEIEGTPALQLSCTSKIADGMVVRTNTSLAANTRQAVLSLILSYHSDRCLTCHRVVKCKPGDTCLRDDSVTHRCLTCSKNYRCELQTTCEMLEMAGYEPWDGDTRTYYTTPQPEPDQANPFLEFDPQMCIICTRCVRACDEIRHTGAITLAGRGPTTRIAFGADGPVHDSNCDFCGSCIDVCPTAALMEHPNKWSATQTERWTNTTCTQCSVGCSIALGTKKERGVIVRPDQHANPVSGTQLCVRGRFHYDAVKPTSRLSQPLIKRNGGQEATSWDEALEFTAARIAQVREEHGPDAIAFLTSPLATNEENYLVSKIARAIVGTNNVDSTAGAVSRAVSNSLRNAFGTEALPADMERLAQSKTVLVVADDLESSHNVACLRIKDAVVKNNAKLVVVSEMRGELCDFADVWIQPNPGETATTVATLDTALADGAVSDEVSQAVDLLKLAQSESGQPLSIVFGVPHFGTAHAGAVTAALANIAITCADAEASDALFILPQEANVWGMRDVGGSPSLLPGYRNATDDTARADMERLWGAQLSATPGLTLDQMNGKIKALVVMNDNPLMLTPNRPAVEEMLSSLDFLAVIDSLPTDIANLAHAVFAEAGPWAKDGTTTSADRRILRMQQATAPTGEARQGWQILSQLGSLLAGRLNPGEIRINYPSAEAIADEIAQVVPLYKDAEYKQLDSGARQVLNGFGPTKTDRQPVSPPSLASGDGFALITGRGLFTSYEASAIHSPDADRLHREDCLQINPADAASLGVADGDELTVRNSGGEMRIKAKLTANVPPKAAFVPLYYDGGAVTRLFQQDAPVTHVAITRAS